MAKIFDSVPLKSPKRSKFNLSHERKMSFKIGQLVPMLVQEIVPGDSFRVNTEIFLRFAPLLAPIMHRVNVKTEYFFVPNRLVWSEWEDFITGGRLGTSAPIAPFMYTQDLDSEVAMGGVGTLCDYLGLPTIEADSAPADGQAVSALPFRAYQLIFDEYYRDQNLQSSLDISLASGQVGAGAELDKLITLRYRAWEKDYFTSALPFAQRGATVDVPLSDDPTEQTIVTRTSTGNPPTLAGDITAGATTGNVLLTGSGGEDGGLHVGAEGHGINVNDLRLSVRLQEWLEKMARGGARYVEQLKVMFKVFSSDARLQRPEFLGGGVSPFKISEVLSSVQQVDPTTGDPVGTPQGDMTGHGFSIGNVNGFRRTFEEHGYVIGIISVVPKAAYQQGIHRHWTRFDKLDYYWPDFAHLGEQEIVRRELFYDGVSNGYVGFGYIPRYAEMKYGCSSVHGEFRTSQDFWHMGRIFASAPELNEDFVSLGTSLDEFDRVFAVSSANNFNVYGQLYNRVSAVRPMPYYGAPRL